MEPNVPDPFSHGSSTTTPNTPVLTKIAFGLLFGSIASLLFTLLMLVISGQLGSGSIKEAIAFIQAIGLLSTLVTSGLSFVVGIIHVFKYSKHRIFFIVTTVVYTILGALSALLGLLLATFGYFFAQAGPMHGRPLRWQGKVIKPHVKLGSDWAAGPLPDVSKLPSNARSFLGDFWLKNAQAEYASVPAFGRIAWLLSALGAPPHLVHGAHQAAMEEIGHAQRCFALASAYSGTDFTAQAMPELLSNTMKPTMDPMQTLACESLLDGCFLEEFNADIALVSSTQAHDSVVRKVWAQIAVEERSHADYSWQLLSWTLEQGGTEIQLAVEESLRQLKNQSYHPLVQWHDEALQEQLVAHGCLANKELETLWYQRKTQTIQQVQALLDTYCPSPRFEIDSPAITHISPTL
jgi:hypothetical protein